MIGVFALSLQIFLISMRLVGSSLVMNSSLSTLRMIFIWPLITNSTGRGIST